MAKKKRKPRTPPPPRRGKSEADAQPRVQAPQVRKKERKPRAPGSSDQRERRARYTLYALGASGIVGLGVVLIAFLLLGKGGTTQVLGDHCVETKYPIKAGVHVPSLKARVKWSSFPPTSGPHYGTPVPWGFYTQRANPRMSLHNLEHGGVDIFYGSKIPRTQVDQLRAFWEGDPDGLLVAPMPQRDPHITAPPSPGLDSRIVMTAWTAQAYAPGKQGTVTPGNGFLISCSSYDEKTVSSFVKLHRGKGPERFPVSTLTPGSS